MFLTNCSNAGLTSIPNNIPVQTTHIVFTNNKFQEVKNNSFSGLRQLLWLDMSNCSIYKLQGNAFDQLQNLKFLYLKDNHLSWKNYSYGEGVFKPLSNQLKCLDIRRNLKSVGTNLTNESYPGRELSVLVSLETLRLDCISGVLSR